jgi:acyl carrier protein
MLEWKQECCMQCAVPVQMILLLCNKRSCSAAAITTISRLSHCSDCHQHCRRCCFCCCWQVRIVDDSGADVAPGSDAVGEVIIRGPTVFGGYWQLPEATAESFTPDGWLTTGDLATRASDGYITVVDRKKDMILCGGENVYSTEVEAVLIAHPAVAQAAVFGVPNAVLGELVAAAVVLRPDAAAAAAAPGGSGVVVGEITEWCRGRLAYYKVPSAIHVVDAMPVTGSGKILKTELRQRFTAAPHAAPAVAAAAAAAAADLQLGVPGVNLQGLVVLVADAVGPGRLQQLPLVQPELLLSSDVSYVLPLSDGVALGQQAQSAVEKGARHLLLLGGSQPTAAALQQLQGVLQEAGAEAAFVILDVPVASDHSLLGYALLDAAQGMPAIEAVLVPAEAADIGVSGITAPAAAAGHAEVPTAAAAGPSVEAAMASVVKDAIAELLGAAAAGNIGAEDPLMQSGVNSTLAVQLTGQLETRLGVSLPATLVSCWAVPAVWFLWSWPWL